ncbi:MAG: hypothetical protein ACRD01_12890 [Terriglobales bacterium]
MHETVNGVAKEFIYGEGAQELTVVDGSQNLLEQEDYLGSRNLGTDTPGGFYWAHADELGTVQARTNASGALATPPTAPPAPPTAWPRTWPPGLASSDVSVARNGSELGLTSTTTGSATNYAVACSSYLERPRRLRSALV